MSVVMAVVGGSAPCAMLAATRAVDPCFVGLRLSPGVSARPSSSGRGADTSLALRRRRCKMCCEATWPGRDFQAGRAADEARRKAVDAARSFSSKAGDALNDARRRAGEFQASSDLGGRVNRAASASYRKLEEFGYDMKKAASRWDQEHHFSEKMQEARNFALEQLQSADRQLGARRKFRNFTTDFRLKWPTYRRQFNNLLDTPIGRSFLVLFMIWLMVSGWLLRIILLSIWVLPLAAPLVLGTLSRAAIVEGTCPKCGQRYIGGRNRPVTCNRCRGVVWQPRRDLSKDPSNPSIIDIDPQ